MEEKRELKKVLIFLYEQFNGCHEKIIDEFVAKQIKADRKSVNEYLKEHNIKATDYYVFFEDKFPSEFKKVSRPIMVINKHLDKSIKRFLGAKLEQDTTKVGGDKFTGMTLKDFIDTTDLGYEYTLREVNNILQENGIKPIKVL